MNIDAVRRAADAQAVVPVDGKPLLQLFGSAMSPPLELFQAVSAHATPTKKDAENAKGASRP